MRGRLGCLALGMAIAGCQTPSPSRSKPATPKPAASAAAKTPAPTATPTAQGTKPPSAASTPTPQPLTRFALLIGNDLVGNYVPGDVLTGPVHVNRGPATGATGRSAVSIRNAAAGLFEAVNGLTHPVFKGRFSMSYAPEDQPLPDGTGVPSSWFRVDALDTRPTPTPPVPVGTPGPFDWGSVFQAPENARAIAGHPGPLFVPGDVALPAAFKTRLGEAIGSTADPATLPWYGGLADGVYLPTAAMAAGAAAAYVADAAPAGGLYVRGTVEVMRGSVQGDLSYYMFQVGYVQAASRVYVLRTDRRTHRSTLLALPTGESLADALAAVQGDPSGLFQLPTITAATALADWAVEGGPHAISMTFQGSKAPFNGVVAVDYGAHDPLRDPGSGRLAEPTGTLRPLTGHILALGDPSPDAKLALPGEAAALPGSLRAAEEFSTEDPATGTATGLTIAAVGSVFVQNHLLVTGVQHACNTADAAGLMGSLASPDAALRGVKDRLAVWGDRQVLIGLAAPGGATRTDLGTLVMGSLIGLEDPRKTMRLKAGQPYPADQDPADYAGSIETEGLMPYYDVPDDFEIGTGPNGATPATGYPANPLYAANGSTRLTDFAQGPNGTRTRGTLTIFGSVIEAKRGLFGKGNTSFDRAFYFDPRLGELPPPLVP